MSTTACVLLDDDDPNLAAYRAMELPTGWTRDITKRDLLSGRYNRFFRRNPDLPYYGILCDDVVPGTIGWDFALIRTAGRDGFACGREPTDDAPHFALGGDLVREMGWLSLAGLDRLFIDTVWNDIARERGVWRQADIVLEHLHFSNGKALMDAVYRKHNTERDREIYEAWKEAK